MAKVNNIVRIIDFSDENDLYFKLDRLMCTDGDSWNVSKAYRLEHLELIGENRAIAYLEEDLNLIQVRFFDMEGNVILPEMEPHDAEYMTYKELELVSDLGEIKIDGRDYIIEDKKYEINEYGTRCISMYLS